MPGGNPRARVRRSTPAEIDAGGPEDTPDQYAPQVEGLRREVDAEEAGGFIITLRGDEGDLELLIPPAEQWRQSANDAIREGRFNAWAKSVLSPEDAEAWLEADPTNAQVGQFFEDLGRAVGVGLGESRRSSSASRSTRRR